MRYIQRHSLLARVTHGTVAITTILLSITGVFVFVPSLGGGLMGGEFTYLMRMLHRVFAVPFIVVPIFAALKSPAGMVQLFKEDIFGKWDKDDYVWAAKFPFYLFAPSKVHMPPQHHVKSAQRLADGALVFFCIGLTLSGIVLWLNTGFPTASGYHAHFEPNTILFAKLVHDICFFLVVFVGIAHIYLGAGIFQPYRGTHRIMFGDGKVSESDAAYHWGYWANLRLALDGDDITEEPDNKTTK